MDTVKYPTMHIDYELYWEIALIRTHQVHKP